MTLYQQRREWLLSQIEEDSVVILVGNTEKVRNKNILYPFRQDHDFYYLTGFAEPDAVAVLRPGSDQPFVLFNQPNDEYQEVWFAARSGQKGAVEKFGADKAYDIAKLEQQLPALLGLRKHVYLSDELGLYQHRLFDWLHSQRKQAKFDQPKIFRTLHSVLPYIQNKRRIKTTEELSLLKHAVNASVDAHKHVMSICKPGMTEQQITAEFFNRAASHGCSDVGYPTISAAGNNACCLHYSENRDALREGELLLLDAGGDYNYYTADITRTFPINGTFTSSQRDIYQLVLNSLDAAIETVKPGASWNSMYPMAMKVLAEGLIDLDILKCSLDEALETKVYEQFTLHKTGHWLGMDVHDVGAYLDESGDWVSLQPNMVFTIEPGLYFPMHCQQVDEKWRGMGVRIEDDILVTETGYENLSAAAPRTIADIESVMCA
ncbi:M24 family metallopeptidase [Alteromonadaceae bacterium M269]|nr:M24 family metallopeptidase [Alteromonadaceae bacterium M269]